MPLNEEGLPLLEECLYCESFCQKASKLYDLIWDIQKARRHIIPKNPD